jgi:hypothetical protein
MCDPQVTREESRLEARWKTQNNVQTSKANISMRFSFRPGPKNRRDRQKSDWTNLPLICRQMVRHKLENLSLYSSRDQFLLDVVDFCDDYTDHKLNSVIERMIFKNHSV